MKFMVFLILLIVGYIAFLKPDPIEQQSNAIKTEHSIVRSNKQDKILKQLLLINDPNVSVFVQQWEAYAPQPSETELAELNEISENIHNDKSVAEKYTVEWHKKNSLCGKVKPLIGEEGCNPGL